MNASRRLALLVTLAALTACGGGNSAPVAPVVTNGTSAANGSHAPSVPYSAGLMTGATLVGRAQLKTVGFDVLVTMRDPAGLQQYAKDANDPANPLYRHWLTPQELGDRFGASANDYAAATAYLAANGIAYKAYPQRQMLRIGGPQANVERAFGVQFGYYRKGAQTFLAPIAAPRPAAALHVAALGNVVRLRLKSRRLLPLRPANSFVDGYSPEQLANAFDYTGAYAAGYKGDGITIGIIGTGAITDGDSRIAGGDVAEYRALFGYGGTGVVKQDVDLSNYSSGNTDGPPGSQYSQTGLATPPPVTSPTVAACVSQGFSESDPSSYDNITDFTTCNPEDTESQLDTEQASSLAPDATVNFYVAYNPSECYATCSAQNPPAQELGLNESDDEIQQAIGDDKSDVVSMSFGLDEADSQLGPPGDFGTGTNNFGPLEFASLASEGIAVFASSGDNGAEACSSNPDAPCVSYPATDPSVISVGGVNLPLDNSGRLTGPMTGWGVQTQISDGAGGSGGGCSAYFTEPSYGSAASLPCAGKRVQPDLALDADTNTGVAVVLNAAPSLGGRIVADVGGTSVASPEAAAMWALVLQACKQTPACVAQGSGATPYRLGNPGPYLYAIYENAAQYQASFYDVLFGNNALPNTGGNGLDPGYTAGQGFDLVTGIGAPYGRNLISSVLAHVP